MNWLELWAKLQVIAMIISFLILAFVIICGLADLISQWHYKNYYKKQNKKRKR